MRSNVTSPGFSTDPSAFGADRLILVGWLKRIPSALCYLGGGHARQEDVEVSPTRVVYHQVYNVYQENTISQTESCRARSSKPFKSPRPESGLGLVYKSLEPFKWHPSNSKAVQKKVHFSQICEIKPETRTQKPKTRIPKPEPRNSKHSTPNPKPQTSNPEP